MLGNLYLLKNFNNYFNRKVIKKDTLQQYLDIVGEDGFYELKDTNFNPNDGVNTSHIVGDANNPYDNNWSPDYVLYIEDGIIISRWFCLEFIRKMGGQFQMSLKRDTIVDKYDLIVNAPTYIEKGHVNDDDSFIVNNEGIQVNQIKKKEYYIKDEVKTPWVIAYVNQKRDKDYTGENKIISKYWGLADVPNIQDTPILRDLFISGGSLITSKSVKIIKDGYIGFNYVYGWKITTINQEIRYLLATVNAPKSGDVNTDAVEVQRKQFNGRFTPTPQIANYSCDIVGNKANRVDWFGNGLNELRPIMTNFRNNLLNSWDSWFSTLQTKYNCDAKESGWNKPDISPYVNRVFKDSSTGKLYKVVPEEYINMHKEKVLVDEFVDLWRNIFTQSKTGDWENQSMDETQREMPIRFSFGMFQYNYKLVECVAQDIELSILKDTYQTQDVPYDIIAFPLFDTNIYNNNNLYVKSIGEAGKQIARAMVLTMTIANVFDIQILPFCPCRELIDTNGHINIALGRSEQILDIKVKDSDQKVGVGIICKYPYNSFKITGVEESYLIDSAVSLGQITTITDRKIQANTDMYRLVSPNYASSFEFNLAKCIPINKPELTYININYFYRPYQPYIHVCPDFGFLYGEDFNDSRGLFLSGDFGITTMSDKWQEYQLNNKNYENMFNRQIKSLETNRAFAREQENFDLMKANVDVALGGVLGGLIGGAMKGGVAGGIMGGVSGIVKGGMNVMGKELSNRLNEERFNEERSFRIDMFNMQMDNIKALPLSLTHTTALANNFKYFPILEYYTCTDEEKNAISRKILANGMTVGRVETINNSLSEDEERFVKGQIIRLEFLEEDSHLANDIYNEVNKGLFFYPYTPIDKGGKVYGKK